MSTILWADDEIDLLKPHILFLNAKGYDVTTACSGADPHALTAERGYDHIKNVENFTGRPRVGTQQRVKR
ncbi:MAG: hypothetical protein K2I12_02025 [Duncaniella sp.]|nr:hypothetical protein [Duncaniella sp.]